MTSPGEDDEDAELAAEWPSTLDPARSRRSTWGC